MQTPSDARLLRDYAEHGRESAFTELVARHTNLVYSAALRQVESPDAAAEVAQQAFIGLARGAQTLSRQLAGDASLAGWLCRSARNLSLNHRRDEFRRHKRERQAMAEHDPTPEKAPEWEQMRPVLDEAMAELNEPDYDALVLRFYQNQDLRSVGRALGLSDDAAQKRVSRALDKLRDLLSRRGVTTSAAALSVALTANAVQAAPAGLAVTISTTAALGGTAIASTATSTATKAIAMTTMQKTVIGATLAVAVGTGVYEGTQASSSRNEVQTLRQQQSALTSELTQLRSERDETSNNLAVLREENERLRNQPSEVLKLRAEVSRLREETRKLAQTKVVTSAEAAGNDPFVQSVLSLAARAIELGHLLGQNPSKRIPEFELLKENDWLEAARKFAADPESDPQKALNELRFMAKQKFLHASQPALRSYIEAHQGQLPSDISELKPYFNPPLDDAILQRYQIANTGDALRLDWSRNGKVPRFDDSSWVLTEKGPPADNDDDLYKIGLGISSGGKK